MSAPIICKKCGDMIGELDGYSLLGWGSAGMPDLSEGIECPGQGNHSKPEITTRKRKFGLVKEEKWYWPDTMTESDWHKVK